MNDWLSSFMMNQATPHLGARSCLVSNESRNHRGQPTINTAFIIEWMAGTLMSWHKKTRKASKSKQMSVRNGGPIFLR
jgi:hypothetical protein